MAYMDALPDQPNSKKVNREILDSKLIEPDNVGHIPYVQTLDQFIELVLNFVD